MRIILNADAEWRKCEIILNLVFFCIFPSNLKFDEERVTHWREYSFENVHMEIIGRMLDTFVVGSCIRYLGCNITSGRTKSWTYIVQLENAFYYQSQYKI